MKTRADRARQAPLASLLPRTLFGRLFLMLVLILLAGQALTWALLSQQRNQLLASQLTEQVLDYLAAAEDNLADIDPAEREAYLNSQDTPYGMYLQSTPRSQAAATATPGRVQIMTAQLRARLGRTTRFVYQDKPKELLSVRVKVLDRDYWLDIPLGRYQDLPPGPFILGALAFVVLAAIAAGMFTWRMNQPLRRLAAASEAVGRGEAIPPLPEQGSAELRELTEAFNRMQHNLELHEQERRLWLAGVSHDLRTPLARLLLALELLPDDADHRGMRDDINDMGRIVQQFIDFARNARDETPQPALIKDILSRLQQRYQRVNQVVELQVENLDQPLQLRPVALERALGNLLDNALRYGQPPFTLHARRNGREICLEVSNRGTPIDPATIEELKAPFRRGNIARSADGGCGLGLAIVDRIVRAQDGRWEIVPMEEGGLRITLRLPLIAS